MEKAKATKKYKITNWPSYNKALINRGNISLWIEESQVNWLAKKQDKSGRGHPLVYGDEAILCALILRSVYHLNLRSLEGFMQSIFSMHSITLPVPSYSQICRRAKRLSKKVEKLTSKPISDIAIDSTGVKVYGEGEWKVRQHGKSKRRTWRKVHLAICPSSGEIVMSQLTDNKVADSDVGASMLAACGKEVSTLYADGAYDKSSVYKQARAHDIVTKIPPRKDGKLQDETKKPWMQERNKVIHRIRELEKENIDNGHKQWKKESGYHKRSLVETAMWRFKSIYGSHFRSRKFENQEAELYAKSVGMNKMTRLGMPEGKWVAA